jgi:hypothetical protein
MSDQPLTLAVLARFHQEILMPEVRQVVREEVAKEVGALRDEMHSGFDAIAQRFDRLETEYHMLVAGATASRSGSKRSSTSWTVSRSSRTFSR